MADDEVLQCDGLRDMLTFLGTQAPDFVSPRWLRTPSFFKKYARKVYRTGRLHYRDVFQAAGHAPGLVFSVEKARGCLGVLRERLERGCTLATTYPQVVILCEMMLAGCNAMQLARTIGMVGNALPSQLVDRSGRSYWSLESRRQQLNDAVDYLQAFAQFSDGAELLAGAVRVCERRVSRAAKKRKNAIGDSDA
jgi:hypothetical protein